MGVRIDADCGEYRGKCGILRNQSRHRSLCGDDPGVVKMNCAGDVELCIGFWPGEIDHQQVSAPQVGFQFIRFQ